MTAHVLMVLLGLTPLASPDPNVQPVVQCTESCKTHVPAGLQSKVCAECLRQGGGPGSWTRAFGTKRLLPDGIFNSAMKDPSWEVRFGVLHARAESHMQTDGEALTGWVRSLKGPAKTEACIVSARGAADSGQEALDAAKKWCASEKDAIRAALEPELYLAAADAREAALRHLIQFFGEGPGKIVTTAMKTRPDALDEVPANLLLQVSKPEFPAGKMLMGDAGAGNEKEVNRLLAIFAKQIDLLRPQLSAADPEVRRDGVKKLALYLPITQPELEARMNDGDFGVRMSTAQALADGSGRSVAAEVAARAKEWNATTPAPAVQQHWVEALARTHGCGKPQLALAQRGDLAPSVRGAAYAQLGICGEGKLLPVLAAGFKAPEEEVRAGAIHALVDLKSTPQAAALAAEGLLDPSPKVIAEALRAVASQGVTAARDRAFEYLGHASPEVRLAAAEVISGNAKETHATALRDRLKAEPEAKVRAVLVKALARAGGSVATATLADVQANDPDDYVRRTAVDSLRNLGFQK